MIEGIVEEIIVVLDVGEESRALRDDLCGPDLSMVIRPEALKGSRISAKPALPLPSSGCQ